MNALSDADLNFVKSVKHANTPIGVVAIANFKQPIPEGWERLSY